MKVKFLYRLKRYGKWEEGSLNFPSNDIPKLELKEQIIEKLKSEHGTKYVEIQNIVTG